MLAQAPGVTIIHDSAPIWRDLLTTGVPATIALLVVWIGGRQLRDRQREDAAETNRRWDQQQAFERKRLAMQERGAVYAEYLAVLDELMYLVTHVLAHHHPGGHDPDCESDHEDAIQDWMRADERHSVLTRRIVLVGSLKVYALVLEIDELLKDLRLTYPTPEAARKWFVDEDGTEPGPACKRFRELGAQIMLDGREEVNAFPIDEEYDDIDLEGEDTD